MKVTAANNSDTMKAVGWVDANNPDHVHGAIMQAQTKLPAGDLAYSFQASDGKDGGWIIGVKLVGDDAHGSGDATAALTALPPTASLPSSLSMLGFPLMPRDADLRNIILGGDVQTAIFTGNNGPSYQGLPFPPARPGMGFWMRNSVPLTARAAGQARRSAAAPVQ